MLDDQSIADILLVWSRFKPGALVEISYPSRTPISRRKFHKAVADFKEVLGKLGLHYELKVNYPKTADARTRYTPIAKNGKVLKKLAAALREKDVKKRRVKTGLLLGYPKTAATAFAGGDYFSRRDLPSSFSKAKYLKFLNFRLSRFWRKELSYVKRKAGEIKKISPELYTRITRKS